MMPSTQGPIYLVMMPSTQGPIYLVMMPSTQGPIYLVMMPVKLFSWLMPTMPFFSTIRLPSKISNTSDFLFPPFSSILTGNTLIYLLMVLQYYPKRELLRVILLPHPCMLLPSFLSFTNDIDHIWYADDATLSYSRWQDYHQLWHLVGQACQPWSSICLYVNASKICLVAKQSHHLAALTAFHDTQITIAVKGRPHLRATLGTSSFVQHYVKIKVDCWAQELNQLASIAANNPHATFAAFTHDGLSSKSDQNNTKHQPSDAAT